MPTIARFLGLILALAGPGSLGAQESWSSQRADAGPTARDPAPLAATAASSRVVPAVHLAEVAAEPVASTAAPSGRPTPLPLGLGARSQRPGSAKTTGGLAAMVTVIGSLAVVLGLFLGLAWAMRRATPCGSLLLPGEVFEVLGRAPLASRQQVHLLRCGKKLL
jgi:hypothetical protein